jgi:hypothetical protein
MSCKHLYLYITLLKIDFMKQQNANVNFRDDIIYKYAILTLI